MIRKIIGLAAMFFEPALQSYNQILIRNLASRHLSAISVHDVGLSHSLGSTLENLEKSNIDINTTLVAPTVKKIFEEHEFEYTDVSMVNSIRAMQYLILLSLYKRIFQFYITSTESFLNDLLTAKKYWMYEDFYMKQPLFGKNFLYNLYSSDYQSKITTKLAALYEIENDVAGILGFCLYGLTSFHKINDENDMVNHMINIVDKFFKLCNTPELNDQEKNNPAVLYNHLLWMNDNLKQHMNLAQSGMKQNDKASFIIDRWFGVSCATVAVIAAALMYTKHKQNVKLLYEQGKIAAPNFFQEYIVDPLVGLKEVVWDHKTKELQHVEHFSDIPKFPDIPASADIPEFDSYLTIMVNSFLNPIVKVINRTKKDLVTSANDWKEDFVKTANEWKDASEKTLNIKIDEANNTIIKSNQINMYLATIIPVLLGTYMIGSSTHKIYDHYIKHKNWYVPMKYIIRSIDQLVNQVARSAIEHNFVDDGKLYMQVQHLKGYIVCLNNEELFLMYNDIDELLSFDLNYGQKKGIIDRMYKTYDFLK